jgi:response regulator RpfG family c-di-GMP phosphodiesterase
MHEGSDAAPRRRVLVVDDEIGNLETFRRVWRRQYDVIVADSAAAGLALLAEGAFDVVLTDYGMPEMNGAEFVRRARRVRDVAFVMVTGYADIPEVQMMADGGELFSVVGKPWTRATILDVVERASAYTDDLRGRTAR